MSSVMRELQNLRRKDWQARLKTCLLLPAPPSLPLALASHAPQASCFLLSISSSSQKSSCISHSPSSFAPLIKNWPRGFYSKGKTRDAGNEIVLQCHYKCNGIKSYRAWIMTFLKGNMEQLEDEGIWTRLRVAGHAPVLWSGCHREKCLMATDQV